MIGWELGPRLRRGHTGAWYVGHRPRGYRDAPSPEALIWRFEGVGANDFAALFIDEQVWGAERVGPPFAQVLARGHGPPSFAMERIEAVAAADLVDGGRRVPLETSLSVALEACAAGAQLAALTTDDGAPFGIVGRFPDAGGWWLTPREVRFENPVVRLGARGVDHLPPELLRGRPLEPEMDCWIIASVTVALTRGRLRHRGGAMDIARAILAGPVDPLDDLAEAPAVRAALQRALDPDPSRRPPDPGALGAQLEEAMATDGLPRRPLDLSFVLRDIAPEVQGLSAG